jgi:hypothetical protein
MGTVTWFGGHGNNYWSNTKNWSTGVVPGAGDAVTISGKALYDGDDYVTTIASLTLDGAFGIDQGNFLNAGGA